jgi:predicted enzyme related to lactoylglutathione lyase
MLRGRPVLTAMVFVKDLEAMAQFYRDGFELTDDADASEPAYVLLTREATRIALHAVPAHVASAINISDPPQPRSEAAMKMLFTVDDVTSARSRLEQLGGHFFETSTDNACDGTDPEGNVFRISAA